MKNTNNKKQTIKLTTEQVQFLDKERQMHLKGITKSYTREEANQIINGKQK